MGLTETEKHGNQKDTGTGISSTPIPYPYQRRAIEDISEAWRKTAANWSRLDDGYSLDERMKRKLLSAPTGSGKTMIVSHVLAGMGDEWQKEGLETVFFVLAPNSLNEQLQADMQANGVGADGVLNPVSIKSVAQGIKIAPWDIVYTNYSSVDKVKNTVIVENERGTDLYTQMEKLREAGVMVVLIVDEAHVNYSGAKAQGFINDVLQPDLTLLVTATPHDKIVGYDPSDDKQTIRVSKEDAVNSGALVHKVILNKGIEDATATEDDGDYKVANLKFVQIAAQMKKEMDAAYQKAGVNVNCLLGIQIPSKTKNILEISEDHGERRKDSQHEKDMLNYVLEYLKELDSEWYVTETDDGRGAIENKVAIKLAERKTLNSEDEVIKPNTSEVDVIIFKEAIAVGWDCPRLSVGALLRDSKTKPFVAQTGGRFMRMPEQVHYDDELLNNSYLYTAHNLIKQVLESGHDTNISTPPEEVGLHDSRAISAIVEAVEDIGGLPHYYRQRNNEPVIKRENIAKAGVQFMKDNDIDPAQFGGGIGLPDWKKLGVDTRAKIEGMSLLSEQEWKTDDLNQEYKSFQSNILPSDVDREQKYRKLVQSSASHGSLKLQKTAVNMMRYLLTHMMPRNIVDGKHYTEQEFINIVLADKNNTNAFQRVIEKILKSAGEIQGGGGQPDIIVPKEENWFIPPVMWIDQEKLLCRVSDDGVDGEEAEKPAISEALHECIDKHPGSAPETTYLEKVPGKIREVIDDKHGGHIFHGYMKNGEQGSHFGIRYSDDDGDHIFYPDFLHFFMVNSKLSISIIEVKEEGSGKGDDIKTIRTKAEALSDYCKDQRGRGLNVHGEIWAFGRRGTSVEEEVTVIVGDEELDTVSLVGQSVDRMMAKVLGGA